MPARPDSLFAVLALAFCVSAGGCMAEREHVLAPDAHGVVIDVAASAPVEGAQIRFRDVGGASQTVSGADGRFTLEGLIEIRQVMPLPGSGVYRDTALVSASADGYGDGYASAAFINGLGPAAAENAVIVLLLDDDAAEPELSGLMGDCLHRPEQHHAVRLAAFLGSIDPAQPPHWLDAGAAVALDEHLRITLSSALFMACERTQAAHRMFSEHMEPLKMIARSAPADAMP